MSIPGLNVMLVGGTGTGKTYSIRSLIEAGITPFVLFTEPGFSTLGDVPKDKLHWHYLPAAKTDWATLLDSATKINTMSYDMLAKQKDINKRKYGQFLEIMKVMNDFPCDRTGEHFGDVSSWGPDRAIVIDSLSGLNQMAMDLVVGSKPTKAMSDWGVAMDNLERFLNAMCMNTNCHFILTAHLEKLKDEITGAMLLQPLTLGQKLGPKLPRYFDEIIQTKNDGGDFHWATTGHNIDLKTRHLPLSDKLTPSFVPLVEEWKNRGGVIPEVAEGC